MKPLDHYKIWLGESKKDISKRISQLRNLISDAATADAILSSTQIDEYQQELEGSTSKNLKVYACLLMISENKKKLRKTQIRSILSQLHDLSKTKAVDSIWNEAVDTRLCDQKRFSTYNDDHIRSIVWRELDETLESN
jgi:hypothetical protein